MKKCLFILSATFFLAFAACKSKAKTQTSSQPVVTDQPTVYKGVTNDSCAVEVAFGSYGAGIDLKSYDAVMKTIESKKLKYTAKSIGREGETRLCLPLTEMKGKAKSEWIDQLKKIAAEGQLVSVSIR